MALAALAAACLLAAAATAAPSARSDAPAANAKAAPTVPFQLTDDSTGVSAFATASRQRREQGGSAAAPEELHLVFDADAHHFDYRLHRIPSVFAAGAGVTVEGVRHAITEEETPLSYASDDHGGAVITFIGSGKATGVVASGEQAWNIATVDGAKRLAVDKTKNAHKGATCGQNNKGKAGATSNATRSRSARAVDPGAVEKWTSCYPGADMRWSVGMGMAMGYKAQQRFGNTAEKLAFLQSLLVNSNYYIYERQLNIVLTIKETLFAPANSQPSWDDRNCNKGIDTSLDNFMSTSPLSGNEANVALWHLIEDCWFGSGTAGYASVSTLCETNRGFENKVQNRGVTYITGIANSETEGTWDTFAHEVGHNFGGLHPFSGQDDQGAYGGIMDYGSDNRIKGEHQFNKGVNYNGICETITRARNNNCPAIVPYVVECGNGIIEDGENCECANKAKSCRQCSNCRLAAGAVCTPDAADDSSTCCTSAGQFQSFGTSCGTDQYCGFGVCNAHHNDCPSLTYTMRCNSVAYVTQDAICSDSDWKQVCTAGGDCDCQRGCNYNTAPPSWCLPGSKGTTCMDAHDVFGNDWALQPDGNTCRQGLSETKRGVCKSGKCVGPPASMPDTCAALGTTGVVFAGSVVGSNDASITDANACATQCKATAGCTYWLVSADKGCVKKRSKTGEAQPNSAALAHGDCPEPTVATTVPPPTTAAPATTAPPVPLHKNCNILKQFSVGQQDGKGRHAYQGKNYGAPEKGLNKEACANKCAGLPMCTYWISHTTKGCILKYWGLARKKSYSDAFEMHGFCEPEMDTNCEQLGDAGSGDGYRAKRAFKDLPDGATTRSPGGCSQLCKKTAGCNYWIVHNTKGCFMHKETKNGDLKSAWKTKGYMAHGVCNGYTPGE